MTERLPEHRHHAGCGCYLPEVFSGVNGDIAEHPPVERQPQIVHQHIHEAQPDRVLQRLALGSGVGAGAVAAGVYFGPLLVGVLTAIAANLAILTLLASVCAWGVVTVVKAVGSKGGQTTAKTLRRRRGRKG